MTISSIFGRSTINYCSPIEPSFPMSDPWDAELNFIFMEVMLCGYRFTRKQSLLVLVSSTLLVILLVTFVWRSSDGNEWKRPLAARPRCPTGDADCNGDGVAGVGRRLHVARSRGLRREKAALQRYELQPTGECACTSHNTNHTLDHPNVCTFDRA